MTLNERLFVTRLMDEWDAAVRAGNRRGMLAILRQVQVSRPEQTVNAVLGDLGMRESR
jgi:hypothetical protein